jgi:chemotaxis signal transduction protein
MMALSFYAGGEWFAADIAAVSKVARNVGLTPVPAAPEGVAGIAGIKGKVVAMLDLAAMRGAKPSASNAQAGRKVNAVVFKGTGASPEETGVVIEKPGDMLELEPELLTRPRQDRDSGIVTGHYDSGGILYSVIDAKLIASRFMDGSRRNAEERQKGAENE